MLGRIILIALQIVVAWFAAPQILRYIPVSGDVAVMVQSIACGVLVWVVGLVGSQALKDVSQPSSTTLAWSMIGGAIGGALVIAKVPGMISAATNVSIVPMFVPLALAIVGYAIRR
ncbi:MAG: hypothetical protein ACOYLQ_00625 [Hyphomicrobiaceae bacterium]